MIISRTPLRISFVGGGSDLAAYYKETPGAVVSTSINRYIYITANPPKYDGLIRVRYSKNETVSSVDEVEHHIVRSALKLLGISSGIEIVCISDMPIREVGTGLAASSALAVGVLNALYALKGIAATPEQLARDACEIEINVLGHPIGKQDQYAVAYGGLNYVQFNSDESVQVRPLGLSLQTMRSLEERLMLFYTGAKPDTHMLLGEQRQKTPQHRDHLDAMVSLAQELPTVLAGADMGRLGAMLHENWQLKQKLASMITNDTINGYYQSALRAGAAGGKIVGSGGGGFLLFYCQPEFQPGVRTALSTLKELPFRFEPGGSSIIYNNGNY